MTSLGALRRARALVGTKFRLQGRDPRQGVDCIGLVMAAHRIGSDAIPNDYRLSSIARREELLETVERWFRRVSTRAARPGDLVVMQLGARQLHLGILTDTGLVHADTRRGSVIEGQLPDAGVVKGYYRRRRARRD